MAAPAPESFVQFSSQLPKARDVRNELQDVSSYLRMRSLESWPHMLQEDHLLLQQLSILDLLNAICTVILKQRPEVRSSTFSTF